MRPRCEMNDPGTMLKEPQGEPSSRVTVGLEPVLAARERVIRVTIKSALAMSMLDTLIDSVMAYQVFTMYSAVWRGPAGADACDAKPISHRKIWSFVEERRDAR